MELMGLDLGRSPASSLETLSAPSRNNANRLRLGSVMKFSRLQLSRPLASSLSEPLNSANHRNRTHRGANYAENETKAMFNFLYLNRCLPYIKGVKVYREMQKFNILPGRSVLSVFRHAQYCITTPKKLEAILPPVVYQAVKSAIDAPEDVEKNNAVSTILREKIREKYIWNNDNGKFERVDQDILPLLPIHEKNSHTLSTVSEPLKCLAEPGCSSAPLVPKVVPKKTCRGPDYTPDETSQIFEFVVKHDLCPYISSRILPKILFQHEAPPDRTPKSIKKHIDKCVGDLQFLESRTSGKIFRQVRDSIRAKTGQSKQMSAELIQKFLPK